MGWYDDKRQMLHSGVSGAAAAAQLVQMLLDSGQHGQQRRQKAALASGLGPAKQQAGAAGRLVPGRRLMVPGRRLAGVWPAGVA